MWDLGFQLGHSVRSIADIKKISKNDLKEFTSYLTRRALISTPEIDIKISKTLNGVWSKKSSSTLSFWNKRKDIPHIIQQHSILSLI